MYMCVHLCVHLCFHVRVWRPETNFGYFSPWLCTILFRVGTFTKLRSCFLSRLTDWLDSNLLESACLCFPDQCSYRATLPRLAFVLVSEIWTQVLVLVLQTFLSTESFPQHHFMHIFFLNFWDQVFLIWFLVTFICCESTCMCQRITCQELILSFQDVGPQEQTRVIRLGS